MAKLPNITVSAQYGHGVADSPMAKLGKRRAAGARFRSGEYRLRDVNVNINIIVSQGNRQPSEICICVYSYVPSTAPGWIDSDVEPATHVIALGHWYGTCRLETGRRRRRAGILICYGWSLFVSASSMSHIRQEPERRGNVDVLWRNVRVHINMNVRQCAGPRPGGNTRNERSMSQPRNRRKA